MITDINNIKKSSVIDADVCIIGSGAAGISLACEFLKSPLRVVLLEGGGLKKSERNQKFYDLETSDLPIDKNSRVRAFGGTTTVWGGGWKLLDEIDFEVRDWVPFSGWPIRRQELDAYYDRAAQLVGGPLVKDFELDSVKKYPSKKKFYIIETETVRTTLLRILPEENLDFGKKFQREIEQSESLNVLLNSNVTRLVLNESGSTIAEATVITLDGVSHSVRAKKFILACGGIENARLLLFSNIGNGNDQVGRYYMDHPKCAGGSIVPSDKNLNLSIYWKPQNIGSLTVAGLQLSPEYQKKNRALNSYVQLRPWYVADSYLLLGLKIFTSQNIFLRIFKKIFKSHSAIKELRLRNYMEQAPSPDNRVLLSDKKDTFGNPLAKISWSVSENDIKGLRALHSVLKQEFEKLGIGKFSSPLFDNPQKDLNITDASHHMGTTRMGHDPKTSVVDSNCAVHGVSNLFVAGSSVFPTSGHANPTATIIALAIRLADHIKNLG